MRKGVDPLGALRRVRKDMGITAVLGSLFALGLYRAWQLETRYFVALAAGIVLLSLGMASFGRLADFLLYLLVFNIPMAGFQKWLFMEAEVVHVKGVAISLAEFLIVGLYATWFVRVFVTREQPLPRPNGIDALIFMLFVAHTVSLVGAPRKSLGILATIYLVRYALAYFYLAHNLERRHLRWIAVAILAAIVLESGLGFMQGSLGVGVGLGRSKGADAEGRGEQYEVPGIEEVERAEGTLYDSHALGLYLAMMLPLAFTLTLSRSLRPGERFASGAALVVGLAGAAVTWSRSAWLALAVAALLTLGVLVMWREARALRNLTVLLLVFTLLSPWAYHYVYVRLVSAPSDIMGARYRMNWVALRMWEHAPLFGVGAGNYMQVLPSFQDGVAPELPVHNVFLWIASEMGLLGVVSFFGIWIAALRRLWKVIRERRDLDSLVALGVLGGLCAYFVDGMTDPMFMDPVPYFLYWVFIGLSVALSRPRLERAPAGAPARVGAPAGAAGAA
jgi:hypothetical protein